LVTQPFQFRCFFPSWVCSCSLLMPGAVAGHRNHVPGVRNRPTRSPPSFSDYWTLFSPPLPPPRPRFQVTPFDFIFFIFFWFTRAQLTVFPQFFLQPRCLGFPPIFCICLSPLVCESLTLFRFRLFHRFVGPVRASYSRFVPWGYFSSSCLGFSPCFLVFMKQARGIPLFQWTWCLVH